MNKNNKKAFGVLEIILSILLLSLFGVFAVPFFSDYIKQSKQLQIKTDIMLIREGIKKFKIQHILNTSNQAVLENLDDNDKILFTKILQQGIVANNDHQIGSWRKIDTNSYEVSIQKDKSLVFYYDPDQLTFDCSNDIPECIEYSQ